MFVANSYIEIGQELLFDYNDRQSRLPFLRSWPICNEQSAATSKRQLPDATESQPAAKRLNVDSSGSSASSASSVVPSLVTASTSATAGAESTTSTAASTARAAAADNTDTAVPSLATASTSATAAAESTAASTAPAAAADTADSSPSDLLLIARKSKLTKAERQRLYKAAGKRFSAKALLWRVGFLALIVDQSIT